jgi:hypothetical protein
MKTITKIKQNQPNKGNPPKQNPAPQKKLTRSRSNIT